MNPDDESGSAAGGHMRMRTARIGVVAVVAAGSLLTSTGGSTIATDVGGGTGSGVPTTYSQLPQGIATAGSMIYLAEGSTVRAYDRSDGSEEIIGGPGAPCPTPACPAGDGGPATAAHLSASAVAVDPAEDVFIISGRRVLRIDHATGKITDDAGKLHDTGSGIGGDHLPATDASLLDLKGVSSDAAGNVYVLEGVTQGSLVDGNYLPPSGPDRLRRVDHTSGHISTVAVFPRPSDAGNFAAMVDPTGLAVTPAGDAYITNRYTGTVLRVDHATRTTTIVAGDPTRVQGFSGDDGPATSARLSDPTAVAVNAAGDLFVADTGNGRIRRVDHATHVITTVAGIGVAPPTQPQSAGDGGPALAAQLDGPTSLATDVDGGIEVGEHLRVRRIAPDQAISTIAGNGSRSFGGDGGPAKQAMLGYPSAMIYAPNGDLVIADADNHRIRRVDHLTGTITTIAGNGVNSMAGDGLPAVDASLRDPVALAYGPTGDLYYADEAGRIRRIDHTTGIISLVAGYHDSRPSGDGGPATAATFENPTGVAVDHAGNVFVADWDGSQIRRIDHATAKISTYLKRATSADPTEGDGKPVSRASTELPRKIHFDAAGDLYIVEGVRVRKVSHTTGVITTVAGTGRGPDSDSAVDRSLTGPATAVSLYPEDVAIAADGDLDILTQSRVVRVDHVTHHMAPVIGRAGVEGVEDPTGWEDNPDPLLVRLWDPAAISLTPGGRIVIADTSDDRILITPAG